MQYFVCMSLFFDLQSLCFVCLNSQTSLILLSIFCTYILCRLRPSPLLFGHHSGDSSLYISKTYKSQTITLKPVSFFPPAIFTKPIKRISESCKLSATDSTSLKCAQQTKTTHRTTDATNKCIYKRE